MEIVLVGLWVWIAVALTCCATALGRIAMSLHALTQTRAPSQEHPLK